MSISSSLYYGLSNIESFVINNTPYYGYLPEDFIPIIYSRNQFVCLSGDFSVYSDVNDYEEWWANNLLYWNIDTPKTRHAKILSNDPLYYVYLGEGNPYDPQYWYEVDFLDPAIPSGIVPVQYIHPYAETSETPTVLSAEYIITQGNTKEFELSSTNPLLSSLTYHILSGDLYLGGLSGNSPNLLYKSNDLAGIDSFEFYVDNKEYYSLPATITITITANEIGYKEQAVDRKNWSLTASSVYSGLPLSKAIDGDEASYYASEWKVNPMPVTLTVDMGSVKELVKVKVLPRQDTANLYYGNLREFEFYTSEDGDTWTEHTNLPIGDLSREEVVITIPQTSARYFRIVALDSEGPYGGHLVIAEINAVEMVVDDTYVPPNGPISGLILTDRITKDSITWTFSEMVSAGQYCNGDWFAVGPVTITNIFPNVVIDGGWIRNGTEVNPLPNNNQAFDSSIDPDYAGLNYYGVNYDWDRNVHPGITGPLNIITGSVVSTVSRNVPANPAIRPQITDASVLTVVDSESIPLSGSFRPPIMGSDKTSYWTKDMLDFSILKNHDIPSSAPSLESVIDDFARLWFVQHDSSPSRMMAPLNNMPEYGRDQAHTVAEALLSLHLNYTEEEKEPLYINLVQYGIDVYGAIKEGKGYDDNGGLNEGKKAPMVLAATALDSNEIKTYCDAENYFRFHDDRQIWIVTEYDVGRYIITTDSTRPREPYTSEHVGLPEWGEKHILNPDRDGSNWGAIYRHSNSPLCGHALAMLMTDGARTVWNWEPFFLYYAGRFWDIEGAGAWGDQYLSSPNRITPFVFDMFKAHRSTYDNVLIYPVI